MNVFFGKKLSHTTQCEETAEEVDGFVLIGSTNDEKNTVCPGDAINKETPPGYDDLSISNLPEGHSTFEPSQPHHFASAKIDGDEDICTQPFPYVNNQTEVIHKRLAAAVQDVPFKMAASITVAANNRNAHTISDAINKKVWRNFSEFEYNFDIEHHVLRD